MYKFVNVTHRDWDNFAHMFRGRKNGYYEEITWLELGELRDWDDIYQEGYVLVGAIVKDGKVSIAKREWTPGPGMAVEMKAFRDRFIKEYYLA